MRKVENYRRESLLKLTKSYCLFAAALRELNSPINSFGGLGCPSRTVGECVYPIRRRQGRISITTLFIDSGSLCATDL